MVQLVKNLPAVWETGIQSLGWEDALEKGKATQLQYSGLENTVHGVAKNQTRLSSPHSHIFTALVTEIEDQPNKCWIGVLAFDQRP